MSDETIGDDMRAETRGDYDRAVDTILWLRRLGREATDRDDGKRAMRLSILASTMERAFMLPAQKAGG